MQIRISGPAGSVEIEARAGEQLSRAVWLSGKLPPIQLCGGLGTCGRCRVRFVKNPPEPTPDECAFLKPDLLAAGWRLACRHQVPACSEPPCLEISSPAASATVLEIAGQRREPVFLGIDLGTTTIEWRAIAATDSADTIASGSFLNPQAGAGADVISRLEYCGTPVGSQKLSALTWNSLDKLARQLRANGLEIIRSAIAGNTAMLEILFGCDTSGLRHAPYGISYGGGELRSWQEGKTACDLAVPPLPGPFVGGDITAGLLALLECGTPLPFLLADLGTNAELALVASERRLFFASVPLGPAMEGIGPKYGQLAAPGVTVAFSVRPEGIQPCRLQTDATQGHAVRGISATGYISLLSALFALGVMDRSGHFAKSPAMPLAGRLAHLVQSGPEGETLPLPDGMELTGNDVELLLKVKAAFAVAITRVCAAAGLPLCGLEKLCLAGSISRHANPEDLINLGFVPACLRHRISCAGNASLAGACLLASQPLLLDGLANLCKDATILNLADDRRFFADYLASMQWGPLHASGR